VKSFAPSLILTVLLALAVDAVRADISYTGSLSSTTGGVHIEGDWGPVSIGWTVTQNPDDSWHYNYSLVNGVSGGGRNFTHMLLETSSTFTAADLWNAQGNFSGTLIDTYTSTNHGQSNSGLPGTLYGIQFANMTGRSVVVQFDSDRAPTWGDFYTGDGQGYYAWNSGFANPDVDPLAPPANGAYYLPGNGYSLLVPDTTGPHDETDVPEPGSIVLGLCALGAAVGAVRRRKRAGKVQP
jgi:hypothetical protein